MPVELFEVNFVQLSKPCQQLPYTQPCDRKRWCISNIDPRYPGRAARTEGTARPGFLSTGIVPFLGTAAGGHDNICGWKAGHSGGGWVSGHYGASLADSGDPLKDQSREMAACKGGWQSLEEGAVRVGSSVVESCEQD